MRNDKFHGRVQSDGRICYAPGCDDPGEFRAPGVRASGFDGPGDYRWFCLEHVRQFNAGYDFFAPAEFTLKPGETVKIPTGIRVEMQPEWVLKCYPRSGL